MARTKLREVRDQLGYGASDVIRDLVRLGSIRNVDVNTPASLKTQLSRWENGHEPVPKRYRSLFRELYGCTDAELGFPVEAEDASEELIARLMLARTVDAESVRLFARQVDEARRVDRQFGGVTQLDGLRSLISQVQDLLRYNTTGTHRAALAGVLTEASALAGWEALDRNAIRSAWDHHEVAKTAALEAGSPWLLAHSMAQQAFILIDLGQVELAIGQLAEARDIATGHAPALLQTWLAAAHGEGLASAGHRDAALRAFDEADGLLPTDAVDPALPFLFLGGAHLDRWRGNALSKLGEPEAIGQLSDALERLPADFNRARAGMLVDLAFAYAASGNRDMAVEFGRQARRLAAQIKSDRQIRRIGSLTLPV